MESRYIFLAFFLAILIVTGSYFIIQNLHQLEERPEVAETPNGSSLNSMELTRVLSVSPHGDAIVPITSIGHIMSISSKLVICSGIGLVCLLGSIRYRYRLKATQNTAYITPAPYVNALAVLLVSVSCCWYYYQDQYTRRKAVSSRLKLLLSLAISWLSSWINVKGVYLVLVSSLVITGFFFLIKKLLLQHGKSTLPFTDAGTNTEESEEPQGRANEMHLVSESMQIRAENAEQKVKDLEAEIALLKKVLAGTKQELSATKDQVKDARKKLSSLLKKAENAKKETQNVYQKFDSYKKRIDNLIRHLKNKLREAQRKCVTSPKTNNAQEDTSANEDEKIADTLLKRQRNQSVSDGSLPLFIEDDP